MCSGTISNERARRVPSDQDEEERQRGGARRTVWVWQAKVPIRPRLYDHMGPSGSLSRQQMRQPERNAEPLGFSRTSRFRWDPGLAGARLPR
jgi:hypothetical protein